MQDYWLISEEYLKRWTNISEFCDIAQLRPWFKVSEEIFVTELVGQNLYLRLKQGVEVEDLNADELELLELIKPALAYNIAWRATPFIATQIRPAGVIKTVNPQIQPATEKEVANLQIQIKSVCDFYTQRIIQYLCDNSSKFPQYATQNQNPGPNPQSSYGFYIGGEAGCGCGLYSKCNCG